MKAGKIALAGATGGLSLLSSALRNRNRPSVPSFQAYSGYRPPHVNYTDNGGIYHDNLRNVQQMITDTLMRRSQGQDVGFDPKRLTELKENYDINQAQRDDRNVADINNELSGMGLSRNLAARDALLGRYKQDQNRERNKYFNQYDIEDLATRNAEKREATGGLQNLNTQNFGQENKVADFDLSVYNSENAAQNANYGNQMQDFNAYSDPFGDAINTGMSVYGMGQDGAYNSALISALRGGANHNAPKSTPFVDNQALSYLMPGGSYQAALSKRYKTAGV